ncbi:hypothetical protein HDF16_006313 [Granulicella aggregans]|uniref:Uncharacterized protein n=1 Tax=Granulicella aggregans TaxID=474949 RepID=A0A7W8E7C8_9BACT|nr:hypothetical protein [Granulicella aggregans]
MEMTGLWKSIKLFHLVPTALWKTAKLLPSPTLPQPTTARLSVSGTEAKTKHSNVLQFCNFSQTKQRFPATAIILNPSGDDL